MTKQTKDVLKGYFNTGDKPTEQEFADLIDSIQIEYLFNGTTAQIMALSPPINTLVYNTDLKTILVFDGSDWRVIGSGGNSGLTDEWVLDDLTTLVNGLDSSFRLNNIFKSGSTRVYLNGLLQRRLYYTETIVSQTINLSFIPQVGDELIVKYIKIV